MFLASPHKSCHCLPWGPSEGNLHLPISLDTHLQCRETHLDIILGLLYLNSSLLILDQHPVFKIQMGSGG